MGYTKTEFQPKDRLPAKVINDMQDSIIENEKNIDNLTPVVLWENANPSSGFPSQTIPLNIGEYKRFEFKMYLSIYDPYIYSGTCSLNETCEVCVGSSSSRYYARFSPTESGVVFTNMNTASDNRNNIPYQIIGYKC